MAQVMRCASLALCLLCLAASPAMAGPLVQSELRITTPLWDDAVFPDIVTSAEAGSRTSLSVTARTLDVYQTPAPAGHHMHFYGHDAGTLSGATPDQLGGELRFYGDWGLANQTNLWPDWEIGVAAVMPAYTADEWTVGTVSVEGGTWITAFPSGTSDPVTVMAGLLSAAGSNALTTNGAGTLTLVTPMTFISNLGVSTGAIGHLTLVFAPEPGVAAMLVAGAALLAGLARRRRPTRGAPRPHASRGREASRGSGPAAARCAREASLRRGYASDSK